MSKKTNKLILHIAIEVIMILVVIALIVGNLVAFSYASIITKFFGQEAYKTVNVDGAEPEDYYTSNYSTYDDLLEAQKDFAKRVQGEGTVLLKNNGDLPIAKSGKITLLGADIAPADKTSGLLIGGGGSGSIDTKQVPSLYDVFTDAGYDVNETMWNYYTSGKGAGSYSVSSDVGTVGEQDISNMSSTEKTACESYKEGTAVIFIGRSGTESYDIPLSTTEDSTKHYLELSDNELDLIDYACETFDSVVVMLNTMNAMELGPLESRNVSVLWVGAGGQAGLTAYPEILNGTINPSGRLVDTYAYDLMSAPATQNIGDFSFSNDTGNERATKYYVYAEGIYVGYKYYETRYADKIANVDNVGEFDYSSEVMYPFGYGLSYTTFEYTGYSVSEKSDSFEIKVTVKNTGNVAGSEVVQIYMQSPYTQYDKDNQIEKSAVELVGYAKTKEIASGKTDSVTISVPKEYMRVFDAKTAGTYIVDAGDYYFATGKDAHDALNNILKAEEYNVEGDASLVWSYNQKSIDTETYSKGEDGEKISVQFADVDIATYNSSFKYLSRSDWTGTFPTPYGTGSNYSYETTATDAMIANIADADVTDSTAEMPTTGANNDISLASLIGVSYDAAQWDDLLDNLTLDDMMELVGVAGYGTAAIESVNKPGTVDKDGPAGISSTLIGGNASFGYPIEVVFASTYNDALMTEYGEFIAEDALLTGTSGWYAPGVNTHRSAFGGRNFEYFSEDSFLSGSMAASLVSSAIDNGVYCYVKHFALNEQETNRNYACTFVNEQALRQTYLRPFELAVRDGGANAIMTSYNRIGMKWTGHSKALLTYTLRDEWGFNGVAVTDAMTFYEDTQNVEVGLDAGQDIWLVTNNSLYTVENLSSKPWVVQNMREACHRLLYVVANSNAMNGMTADTKVVLIMPAWEIWLIVVDCVLGAAFIVGTVFVVRAEVKNRQRT